MTVFGDGRLPERIWSRIVVDDNGCWVWTGPLNAKGYGWVGFWRGRPRLAHRVTYSELVSELPPYRPDGPQLDHLCQVKACCNPGHLELVTPRVNTLRGPTVAARNAGKLFCSKNHPLFGENVRLRPDGRGRACRACERERWVRRHAAQLAARS